MKKVGRIALKTLLWIIVSIIGLVLLLFILIRIPAVQNYVVQKVTSYLEGKIGTPVNIDYVSLDLPKMLVLEGVYFEDQSGDTLVAGEKLRVDIAMLKLLKNTVQINQLELEGITAKINRTLPDSAFNFDYIVAAFASEEETAEKDTASAPLIFDIDRVNLDRIRFLYDDQVAGMEAELNLNHLNTRIKTFDLAGDMHFAIPKITIDGLHARIRQWSTMSSEEAPSASDFGVEMANEASSRLPKLEFDALDLTDIVFAYEDESSAMDTRFAIQSFFAEFNQLDLNEEFVDIKTLKLEGSDSRIHFGRVTNQPATAAQSVPGDTAATEPMNWKVKVGSLVIDSTALAFIDDNQVRTPKAFDYGNIGISGFIGELTNLYYASDSISGSLKNLQVKDHSGFELKQLRTDFVYTDQGAELADLYAETPNTLIRDRIKITYPSLSTITDRLGEIGIEANLKNSYLGMRDVVLFVPDLDTMQMMQPLKTNTFHIDGVVTGRLDNLRIPRLQFRTLDNTRLNASAHIKGLPDPDRMHVDLDLREFTTSRADVSRLVAADMLPEGFQVPESVRLTGTFNGGMQRFRTDMALNTSEGNATLDANFSTIGRDTVYDANVSIMDIDVGKLIGQDSTLGKISFAAQANGRGLDPATAIADIQANLISAEVMGYTYTDIELNATADQGDIEAFLTSDDPNIHLNMQAFANMREQYPRVKVDLMVDSINLKNLKLMEDEFRYHGRLEADFETADIDHLNGTVNIVNSSIAYNDQRFVLDSVSLRASATDDRTMLQLRSGFLNAHMVGNYELTQLAPAIQDILAVYYQPDSIAPVYEYEPQQFDFHARLSRTKFIQSLVPDLTEMQDIILNGSFISDEKLLFAKLTAPELVYAGTRIEGVTVDVNTVDSTMYYSAVIGDIGVGDIDIINTLISGTVKQNLVDMGLWIRDGAGKERYHIGMELEVDANNFLISLLEDGLMLNYDRWDVNPQNQLRFGPDGILAHQFLLSNNGQSLQIQSQDSIANSPIDLTFDNFRIETFTEMIESEMLVLGGGINGSATVSRLDASPVFVSDIKINDFYFNRDTVGDISIQVDNERENIFHANVDITGNGNAVNLVGDFISPPDAPSALDFTLSLSPLTMHTLEAFSLGYLRNAGGDIGGELRITGTPDAPLIVGDMIFNKAKFNVAMLNADFSIDQQRINFSNTGLRFNRFEIVDGAGNIARINGTLNTKTYTDFDFGLTLTLDDFRVLNSTQADNDLYYGQMYISSNLRIRGDMNNPVVDGTLSVNDNTDVTFVLPTSDPGMVDREGIVVFVDRSDTTAVNVFGQLDSLTNTQLGGLNVAIDISTHRDAQFTVVIDPGTKDALSIRGEADLNAGIEPSGRINLTGNYTVEEGSYSFSFGPVSRKFNFRKGSTIVWAGDPLDARLNITAVYQLRAPTLELVENQIGSQNQNLYRQRIPFNVNLNLREQLFSPELSFDIEMDETNSMVSQDVAQRVSGALAQLRVEESEMNKQVFALLILGRFIAPNPFESLSGGGGVESMARNTVSSMLSSQLNRLAGDLITGVELNFDLQSEEDYSTGTGQNRTDLNVGVSKMLFDDRLKVTVGSNFELEGNARPGEQTTNIAGDISVDYALSRDGRYTLRAYRKNQYQVTLMGQFVETGLGFIMNMDYNEFKEVFMSARRLQDHYDTSTRGFRRRFNAERMETDTAYRDSVRAVIRDSLRRANPEEFEQREREIEERRRERESQQQIVPSNQEEPSQDTSIIERNPIAIRNEQEDSTTSEEGNSHE